MKGDTRLFNKWIATEDEIVNIVERLDLSGLSEPQQDYWRQCAAAWKAFRGTTQEAMFQLALMDASDDSNFAVTFREALAAAAERLVMLREQAGVECQI